MFSTCSPQLSPLTCQQSHAPTADANMRVCTSDTNTPQRRVRRPSGARNVKNSAAIPCFPPREKQRRTERPSLSSRLLQVTSGGWIDGAEAEQSLRETQIGKERFWKNESYSLLICRRGPTARVTFSINCASVVLR